jgi:hypothetical protein
MSAAAPMLAHVGHWSQWVLYMAPVVAVIVAIVLGGFRERRLRAEEEAGAAVAGEGGASESAQGEDADRGGSGERSNGPDERGPGERPEDT